MKNPLCKKCRRDCWQSDTAIITHCPENPLGNTESEIRNISEKRLEQRRDTNNAKRYQSRGVK